MKQRSEMQQALDDFYETEHKHTEAEFKLSEVYLSGKGSPAQRKEAREILGDE